MYRNSINSLCSFSQTSKQRQNIKNSPKVSRYWASLALLMFLLYPGMNKFSTCFHFVLCHITFCGTEHLMEELINNLKINKAQNNSESHKAIFLFFRKRISFVCLWSISRGMLRTLLNACTAKILTWLMECNMWNSIFIERSLLSHSNSSKSFISVFASRRQFQLW